MHFHILTLFPKFFPSPMQTSILQKAQEKKIFSWESSDIRNFSDHANKNIDDVPYGGGGGMLMQAEPVAKAIEHAKQKIETTNSTKKKIKVIFFAPTGTPFTQAKAVEFANDGSEKILLCGHYEGIDQRVIDEMVDEKICVGQSVFTGGEIPALAFIDSIVRLIPEGIGNKNSHENDTFSENFYGKGEFPHYTRPKVWRNICVPDVLTQGNEKKIHDWRMENLSGMDDQEKKILQLRRKKFSPSKPYKLSFIDKKSSQRVSLFLRTPEKKDVVEWYQWFHDPIVSEYMRVRNLGYEEYCDFYSSVHNDLYMLLLSIVDKKSARNIGNISLRINRIYPHKAELGIIIGDKNFWNKGIATKVIHEICTIAKDDLQIERISLDVFVQNLSAQKVYEKCGFTKIGTSKKYYKREGKCIDVFLYEKVLALF